VDRQVKDHAATARQVVSPGSGRSPHLSGHADHGWDTDLAAGYVVMQGPKGREEAHHMTREQKGALIPRALRQGLCLGKSTCQRLFHDRMLTGTERCQRRFVMVSRRGSHNDGINIRAVGQLVQ